MQTPNNPQNNKQAAVEFLQMVVARNIEEAYQKYVDFSGKHHNLFFPPGFQALKKGMIESHTQFPHTTLTIKQVIGDLDMVAVYSHVAHQQGELGFMVVHLFRFKNNKIVEMWDCGQPIPANSPNTDGPF